MFSKCSCDRYSVSKVEQLYKISIIGFLLILFVLSAPTNAEEFSWQNSKVLSEINTDVSNEKQRELAKTIAIDKMIKSWPQSRLIAWEYIYQDTTASDEIMFLFERYSKNSKNNIQKVLIELENLEIENNHLENKLQSLDKTSEQKKYLQTQQEIKRNKSLTFGNGIYQTVIINTESYEISAFIGQLPPMIRHFYSLHRDLKSKTNDNTIKYVDLGPFDSGFFLEDSSKEYFWEIKSNSFISLENTSDFFFEKTATVGGSTSCENYTAVLTHGFQYDGADWDPINQWPSKMVNALQIRCSSEIKTFIYDTSTKKFECEESLSNNSCSTSNQTIFVFIMNWAIVSNDNIQGYSEAAGDALFEALLFTEENESNLDLNRDSHFLHFVGHSRGTVVNSEVVERLLAIGKRVDQVTNLDPHDWGATTSPGSTIGTHTDYDVNPILQDLNINNGVIAWKNINWVDTYYQEDLYLFDDIGGLSGREVEGTMNVLLETDTLSNQQGVMKHTNVHQWYIGTIAAGIANEDLLFYGSGGRPDRDVSGFSYTERLISSIDPCIGVEPACDNQQSPRRPIDFSFSDVRQGIVNGDFRRGSDFATNELPGYMEFGGNHSGSISSSSLTLYPDQSSTHNYMYIPPEANKIIINYSKSFTDNSHFLIFELDGLSVSHPLDAIPTPIEINIPANIIGFGKQFTLSMIGQWNTPDLPVVHIQDISFGLNPSVSIISSNYNESSHQMTLTAQVNPNDNSGTSVHLEWGTNGGTGTLTSSQGVTNGIKYLEREFILDNISCNQTVTVKAVAGISSTIEKNILVNCEVGQLNLNAQPSQLSVSQASTLSATVLDSNSNPVANAMVSFSTGYSGGFAGCTFSGSNCNTTTNASGVASVTFTSSIPGTATISATGENGGTDSATVTFQSTSLNVTVSPNPVNVSGTATITADLGAAGAGQIVTFSTSFPGLFSPGNVSGSAQSTANGSGVAIINFVPSAAGNAIITVNSSISDPQTVSLEVVDPNANINISLTAAYNSGNASSTVYNLRVSITNSSGSPVSGEPVTFTTTRGTLSSNNDTTGGSGDAGVTLSVSTEGLTTITASASGDLVSQTFTAQIGSSGIAEMTPIRTLTSNDSVNGIGFSPDGQKLYAASYNGVVTAWNTSTWAQLWSVSTSDDRVGQLSVSPNGSNIMIAHDDGVDIRSASNGSLVCNVINPDSKGILAAWTSNSTYLETSFDWIYKHTSTCNSGSLTSFQPSNGGFERDGHMDYSSAKNWVAMGEGNTPALHVITTSGSLIHTQNFAGGNVNDTDFTSTGNNLAVSAVDSGVTVFNTSNWSTSGSYSPPGIGSSAYGVKYINSDSMLAIGGNNRVEVVNVSGGNSTRFATVSGKVVEIDWAGSTNLLAVATTAGQIQVYKPLDPVTPPDVIDPIISITSPPIDFETILDSITTTGTVTDNVNISSFTINGSNVSVNGSGSFSSTVSLAPGSNTITYIAKDPSNNTTTETRSVTRLVDSIAPSITNTSVSPSQGVIGTDFTISSFIVDESGVQSANAVIKNNSGTTITTLPLSNSSGSTYQATYNSSGLALGFYTVDIKAVDNSGFNNTNTIVGATGFEVIDIPPDITPPVISNANVSPSSALQGTQFVITADVVDSETGVAQVTAKIKSSQGSIIASQSMVLGNGQTYSTSWDSTAESGDVYTVDITAVDSSPQSNYSSQSNATSFEVTFGPPDTEAPIISNVDVNPIIGVEGTLFIIDADVEDVDSGVTSVNAKVKTAIGSLVSTLPMSNTTGITYSASWNSTGANEEVYAVDITAVDSSPSQNEITLTDAAVLELIPDPLIFQNGFESTVVVTIPLGPSSLIETNITNVQATITWNDNSNNEDGFKVERKLDVGSTWVEIISLESNVEALTDSGLTENTIYNYRVKAFNSAGYSGYSNELSVQTLSSSNTFQDCNDCPIMTNIPGGTFQMGDLAGIGDSWEQPVHSVSVPAFSMGIYEVTFDEWDACFADGGCLHNPNDQGWGRGDRPVINVSWDDAQEYVTWLRASTGKNYSLPSESEWEYAARAGTTTIRWWGDDIGTNNANCNAACGDSFTNTSPVGSFPANSFGLFDMLGNIWEWNEDCKNTDYIGAPNDGSPWLSGDCSMHMDRGGSWLNPANTTRSADRASSTIPRRYTLGFRVAMEIQNTHVIVNEDFSGGTLPADFTPIVGSPSVSDSGNPTYGQALLIPQGACIEIPGSYDRSNNIIFEADVKITSGGAGDFNLSSLYDSLTSDNNCRPVNDGYYLGIYPAGSDNPTGFLRSYESTSSTNLSTTVSSISAGTWFHLKYELSTNGDIKVFIDDVEKHTVNNNSHNAGKFALRAWFNVWVDNIKTTN